MSSGKPFKSEIIHNLCSIPKIISRIILKRFFSNFKVSIISKGVFLPGDKRNGTEGAEKSIPDQLFGIFSHIEDLETITGRVMQSDNSSGYMQPLLSECSDIRIDY